MIDFSLSTASVWSVWREKDGECVVYTAPLQISSCYWMPVVLESIPDAEQPPNIDGETDPHQAYLQYIFHPGRFPLHIINKALNVFFFDPTDSIKSNYFYYRFISDQQ